MLDVLECKAHLVPALLALTFWCGREGKKEKMTNYANYYERNKQYAEL